MFYTRIPCPTYTDHSDEYLNKATRYFPLIGWIVGLISFAAFALAASLFSTAIAVVAAVMVGVLVTGCFHEDGLADVFDGFGGGWTKQRILEIMKDSRVGAYGVAALVFLFALKFLALHDALLINTNADYFFIALIFVSYHSLARLTAIAVSFISAYAREDATSKSKPIAKTNTWKEIVGAFTFGLLPLAALCTYKWQLVFVIIPLTLVCLYATRYFKKWLGGFTGDCLGATEQIAEVVTLLSYIALWKFI